VLCPSNRIVKTVNVQYPQRMKDHILITVFLGRHRLMRSTSPLDFRQNLTPVIGLLLCHQSLLLRSVRSLLST